jgi:hypothetical protein
MNKDYIKYASITEDIPADFDKKVDEITADIAAYVRESRERNKLSYHTRDAHAKGYSALKAEFTVLDNLPPEYAQGFYATPKKYEAALRLSNGSARVMIDKKLGFSQGLAIKIFGVPGEKMTDDEKDAPNMDYNLINHPVFFCNSAEDYTFIGKLFLKINDYFEKGIFGKAEFAYMWATEMGKAFPGRETLKELKALLGFQDIEPKNPFLYSFWSMGAARHGDYVAKVRAHPSKEYISKIINPEVDPEKIDEAFLPAIISEISAHDFEFDIQVQLCKDLEEMPIEELTEEWKEEDSPFVTVAKLYIPKQEVPADGHFQVMENLSFTPFHVTAEHCPIGNLQRTRLRAYQTASKLRHELNQKKRAEPKNLEEAFDPEFYMLRT